MPPKKSKQAANGAVNAEKAPKNDPVKDEQKSVTDTSSEKKRKNAADDNAPQKEPRRSSRSAAKSTPSQDQLLHFLLSEEAEQLCRPDDESEDIQARGDIKTYSGSVLNPFEELLCAVVLSRPISHRLGLRTIRTIFNDPYNFNSAKAVQEAGHEKHMKAVWDARTQHKEKTATQIGQVADVVLEQLTSDDDKEGTQMQKLLDDNGNDVDKALDSLQSAINGLGATGVKIFLRRVQWLWSAGHPYVDDRTQGALKKLGLPEEAEDLQKLIDQHWKQLKDANIAGKDEAEKKRRAFVTVLERAIGADLEGKVDELSQGAVS